MVLAGGISRITMHCKIIGIDFELSFLLFKYEGKFAFREHKYG